jgi:surfeit locus 1 family protein
MSIDDAAVERTPATGAHGRRPGWVRALPTIATIAAVAVCIAAGNWQRGRMEAKQALRDRLDAAAARAPVTLPVAVADWAELRFRAVVATGVFDAARQILIDNRVHAGVVGYAVVTPLGLRDGRVVLVDRGFVAAGPTRAELPAVPPPPGEVTVQGRIELPAQDYFELGRETATGPVRQHLDPRRFAAATGIPVLPIVIEVTAPTGGDQGLARERMRPDVGIDRHRIYMWQWYAFAALAFGLWLWFALRPALTRR